MICRILALLLIIPACSVHAEARTPEEALEQFYGWVLENPASALPSADQRTTLSGILSPSLVELLDKAADAEAQCIKFAQQDEKPLAFEGDIFVGRYEGAIEVSYGKANVKGSQATAEVDLVYVDPRFPKAHKYRTSVWKNRVELRKRGDRWLIGNVGFDKNNSLASILRDYLTDARACRAPRTR